MSEGFTPDPNHLEAIGNMLEIQDEFESSQNMVTKIDREISNLNTKHEDIDPDTKSEIISLVASAYVQHHEPSTRSEAKARLREMGFDIDDYDEVGPSSASPQKILQDLFRQQAERTKNEQK